LNAIGQDRWQPGIDPRVDLDLVLRRLGASQTDRSVDQWPHLDESSSRFSAADKLAQSAKDIPCALGLFCNF
jgi:hypothetical protein